MSSAARPGPSYDSNARWRLQLAGRPQIVAAGARVMLERRDAAMLALLAVDGPTERLRIIALLWPDEDPDAVRNRLRQRIFALKRKLGTEAVAGGPTLALAPALCWPGFDHEPTDRPLLGDDDHADLPEFARWLAALRARRQSKLSEKLVDQAAVLENAGRVAEAIVVAERLLAVDPLREDAHRRLMRLHHLRGDRAAALLTFDRCEQLLKDEVGARPSTETLDLLAQVDAGRLPPSAGPRRFVPPTVVRPPRLIGRDDEWAHLQSAWEEGAAIVVIGEAGMGKTRLLGDLVRAYAPAPSHVLDLSARPGDQRLPYALLSRLLRGLLALRQAPLAPGVEAELARVLPELPAAKHTVRDGDRARFVNAIEITLRDAVVDGLQTIVLDDLQFADGASIEMAQHLAGIAGLRWVAAFRGAEIGTEGRAFVDTLTRSLRGAPIVLQPLTVAQVAELIESLGVDDLDGQALAGALHQRTGGNPLFLLETLKILLLDGGARGGAIAHERALARLPVAGDVVRLIERRIGQLSREAIRLARCAAIAGQDFSASLAARALDVNPLDLADAWNELGQAQVLRDGAFAHDLIFEAARASIPAPIARELHRRIAELLQHDGAQPSRLAHHWLGAGEALRAAPYLAEAGRAALRAMRQVEGFQYFDRAQSIYGEVGDADSQCALIDEVIDVALQAGTYDHAQRLVEQAIRVARSERQRAMAIRSLANLLGHRGEYEKALDAARRALDHVRVVNDPAIELSVRTLLAELLSVQGFAAQAEAVLRASEAWVAEYGSTEQRLKFSMSLASVAEEISPTTAIAHWDHALALARQLNAAHVQLIVIVTRGMTLFRGGESERSSEALRVGLQMMADLPADSALRHTLRTRLQVVDRSLGYYSSVLSLGEEVLSGEGAGPAEIADARLACAQSYAELGQPARARQLRLLAGPADGEAQSVRRLELEADLLTDPARTRDARRVAFEASTELLAQSPSLLRRIAAWRVHARFGPDDQAIAAARSGLDAVAACGMRGQQVVFQALMAQRLAGAGSTADAVQFARNCWQLLSIATPAGLYRGLIWKALWEALHTHDADLANTIVSTAADWIYRTASEHVPPPFRESFLRRNPTNAFLLAKVRAT